MSDDARLDCSDMDAATDATLLAENKRLQARLATAEAQVTQLLGEAIRVGDKYAAMEAKLAHLETLVEGLPVVDGHIGVMNDGDGQYDYKVLCEDKLGQFPHRGAWRIFSRDLTEQEATALAALLEHRKQMTTPPPPASERRTG